jgi:hypothetical protein
MRAGVRHKLGQKKRFRGKRPVVAKEMSIQALWQTVREAVRGSEVMQRWREARTPCVCCTSCVVCRLERVRGASGRRKGKPRGEGRPACARAL